MQTYQVVYYNVDLLPISTINITAQNLRDAINLGKAQKPKDAISFTTTQLIF